MTIVGFTCVNITRNTSAIYENFAFAADSQTGKSFQTENPNLAVAWILDAASLTGLTFVTPCWCSGWYEWKIFFSLAPKNKINFCLRGSGSVVVVTVVVSGSGVAGWQVCWSPGTQSFLPKSKMVPSSHLTSNSLLNRQRMYREQSPLG